jgi:hypothetical protein
MKHRFPLLGSTLILSGLLFPAAHRLSAEDKPSKAPAAAAAPDPAKMAEMMKKVEAAGAPGAPHKALEPLIGEWTAVVKSWMAPGTPPVESKGTAKTDWALNGRFVREEFSGDMMGKPFRGMSLTGYDNLKGKYTSVWVDDMSTAIFTSTGTSDDGGKAITFSSKMDCPATGEKDMPVKQVLRIISADKHIFEMHDPRKGEDSKTMEITYTRK